MLVSYPLINQIDRQLLGALLSLSAGTLVYVGATHLLPKAEADDRKYSLLALGGGVLLSIIIVFSKA